MRKFLKVFIVSFSFFFLSMAIGSYSYLRENDIKLENNLGFGFYEELKIKNINVEKDVEIKKEKVEPIVYDNLKLAMENSNRINFLIMGMDDVRTDTIILASFCQDTKKIDLIHIPRDTYVYREKYKRADQQKINSIYAIDGILALQDTISSILNGMKIHYYATIDYKAVESIVDEVGGVSVDVPFKMRYKDPSLNPPLIIDIPAGEQLLDGKKSLQFLRYRKGSKNEGYIDGDLGRIRAQQDFLKSFIDKAMDNRIKIVKSGFKHIKTDIGLLTALSYAKNVIGMTVDDVNIDILPGKSEFKSINGTILSYYIRDERAITEFLNNMYNVNENIENEATKKDDLQ